MKKYLLSFITVVLIFVFTMYISGVNAKENDIEITNVEISDKSDNVRANIVSFKNLDINLNTIFYSKDEYVTYKITIKNNTKNVLMIDDILGNYESDLIITEYEKEIVELKSGEEYTFSLTIRCINDLEEERITINNALNITINYDNGKSNEIINIQVNPNTNDSMIKYILIFLISVISLIYVFVPKKGKKKMLGVLLVIVLIPTMTYAINTKQTININNDIILYGKTAVFKTGLEVNKQLKELAGTDTSINENTYAVVDTNIREIKRANELPNDFIPSEGNTISSDDSKLPIYAWYDDGILYYYTEAKNPLFYESPSRMFSYLTKLEYIDLETIDTSSSTNMSGLFFYCTSLKNLNLSNFNTTNVKNMYAMFNHCESLEEIDLSNFDTSNVKSMYGMFNCCGNLKELDLSNFNTSNVTNMSTMFQSCQSLERVNLSSFDTSNVEIMSWMFFDCNNLKVLNIGNFNTAKVNTMRAMFGDCFNLEELNISNFDTSNVTSMRAMFQRCQSLEELDLSSFDTSKVTDMWNMFKDNFSLKTLYASERFVTTKVTESGNMFYNSSNLVGGNGTVLNSSYVDKTYARIDTEETPGYFTLKEIPE